MRYPDVGAQPDFPALERETLAYWGTDGTFRVLRREPDQPSTGFTTLILRG